MSDDVIFRSEAIANLMKQPQLTKSVVRRVLIQTRSVNTVVVPNCEECFWNERIEGWSQCEHCIGNTHDNNNFLSKKEVKNYD
jgi:hypothetical protein